MEKASQAAVTAALKARRVKSLLSPVVSVVVALCTAIVLWKGTALIVAGTMTAGALTVYLAYLNEVLQAGEGPGQHDQRDCADDGRAGAHPDDPERRRHPPGVRRRGGPPAGCEARSPSSTSRSAMPRRRRC